MSDTERVSEPLLILVIDDDADLCEATCELLDIAGFATVAQTVPEEAIKTFQADPDRFVLVLLDWTLPRLSGGQVVQALQACRPEVPIVVLSGMDEEDLRLTVRDLGLAAYLQKPYTYQALLNILNKVIGS